MWSSRESDSDGQESVNSAEKDIDTPFRMLFIFLLLWQATYNVSSAGVVSLLRFLRYFIYHLGKAFHCDIMMQGSGLAIPGKMEKLAGLKEQSFTEYVVCPKCSCIFEYKDCNQPVNGKKRCCDIKFSQSSSKVKKTALWYCSLEVI